MKTIVIFLLIAVSFGVNAQEFKANYDESKVPAYTLPNVLETSAQKPVRNKRDWEKIRRPEIIRLFEDHIYGQMPKEIDSLTYSVRHEDPGSMNGKAHLKEIDIVIYRNNKSVTIQLVLFIPSDVPQPVPAF